MFLAEMAGSRAESDPSAPALADDTQTFTNHEFDEAIIRAAGTLAEAGVSKSDVVAIMLPNTADFVIALFAAWRLGATATPVNPSLEPKEIAYQLADCKQSAVVTSDDLKAKLADDVTVVTDLSSAKTGTRETTQTDEHDLALLIYTSGTTGRPKGVMLDHANLTAMVEMAIEEFSLDSSTHSLLILPLFHVNGIVVGALSSLVAGGSVTVAGRFDPRTFFDRVEAARPTYFSGVPTIFAMLANLPEELQPDTSSLQFAVCGAAPASAELLDKFESRFSVPVIEGYGLSEATCASTVNPIHGKRKPGTVGLPLPREQVRIAGPGGEEITDGSAGEVQIKGPNVMRGYLNLPEETEKAFIDGWLRTGDIGRFDEDGYLTLVDRAKDMIIRGGENIYPKEIENVVYEVPGVLEAAVVGRPHPMRGEEPVLFVSVSDPSTTEDVIQKHIDESLSKYKRPVAVWIVDDVPKNPVGKLDKPAMRKRLSDQADESADAEH
ncbi:class I adenylate-forming enzyme family protein [Gordonia zhaorongruii]|uniref:class I adenylate-forming enzyme family protein n=1 Tax=Gordonia zhaorongruii TaxID=2597659 RepID=UPI00104A33CF|nr:AMP-binding protein [Gordonia zhaorongruii]